MNIIPKGFRGFATAIALCLVFAASRAQAAFDAFIRFTEPAGGAAAAAGESVDPQFPAADGWFEISSFDEGILNSVNLGSGSGGAGAGKAKFEKFVFTKLVNSVSPSLFKTSAVGGHYQRVDLALRQSGAIGTAQKPFYTATLETVFVESINWSGSSGDDAPAETVTLVFGAMQWTFTRFDTKGLPVTTFTVNWDQIRNTGGDGPLTTDIPPTLSYPAALSDSNGGSLDIDPTSGPSDPVGIASIVVKSLGGYAGGISVDPVTAIVHLTGAQPSGGPFPIVIEATDNFGGTTDASFNLTVSPIPALIANADTVSRALGRSIKIPVASLVANDSAGAVFDALPTNTTALQGHVTLAGSVVVYDPPLVDPGSSDSFTYRIHDGFSQTAIGTVTVTVSGPGGGPTGNLIIRTSSAGNDLQLAGIPGRNYQLQTAAAADGPWTDFGAPVTADVNGSAAWTDPNPTAPRFYRAFQTP